MTTDPLVDVAALRPDVATLDDLARAELRSAIFETPEAVAGHHVPAVFDGPYELIDGPTPGRRRTRQLVVAAAVAMVLAIGGLTAVKRGDQRSHDPATDTTSIGATPDATRDATTTVAATTTASTAPPPSVALLMLPSNVATDAIVAILNSPPRARLDPIRSLLAGTENPKDLLDRSLAGEPYVASCMRARGWQYTERTVRDEASPALLGSWDPERFRREYGYGIAAVPGVASTPNDGYLATLDEQQRADWQADLARADLPPGGPAPAIVGHASGPPCQEVAGDAVKATGEHGPLDVDLGLTAVDPHFDPDNDVRVHAALASWSGCMASAGYPDDLQRSISQRMNALTDAARSTPTGSADDFFASYDTEALRRLQQDELALAAADGACNRQVGLDAVRRTVGLELRDELQRRFPNLTFTPYTPPGE